MGHSSHIAFPSIIYIHSLRRVDYFFQLMNLCAYVIPSPTHSAHLSSFLVLSTLQIWTDNTNYHSIIRSSFLACMPSSFSLVISASPPQVFILATQYQFFPECFVIGIIQSTALTDSLLVVIHIEVSCPNVLCCVVM